MTDRKIFVGGEFLVSDVEPNDVFTPEDFTEEHRMIRDTSREFTKNDVEPRIDEIDQKNYALNQELLAQAGELGLLGTDVPEAYGGLGLDKVSTTIVTEYMGSGGSWSGVHGAHTGIGTLPIVYFGSEEQKKKYLPKLASGEWCGAYCLTEAGSGSDALAAKCKAVLSEDKKHYILNGEKVFITNAAHASTFIVYAKVDGDKFTGFILEKDTPGLSIGKEEHKLGMLGTSTCPVILEDAKVPVENVLFEVGKGHKIAFNALNFGRWKLGAGAVGGAKGCLAETVQYANQRVQFGQPIAQFGLIKEKIANMTVETYMAESMMYRLAGMFDDKLDTLDDTAKKDGEQNAKAIEEYAVECSIAKVYGSEMLDRVVDEAVQIHGGYGYIAEYPAERHYRDSRINRIWEGSNEINRLLIPGTLVKRAMQGRLKLMEAAQSIPKELMTYSPLSVKLPDTPLAVQAHMVKMGKKLALMVAGVAAQKFQMALDKEQEVLGLIADMVIDLFAMESGLLRAQKVLEAQGEAKASAHIAAVKIFVDDAMPRLETNAKKVVAYAEDGDMLRTQLAGIKKLARYQVINTVELRRQIADLVIERENYPL